MLDSHGTVKLCDFGLVRYIHTYKYIRSNNPPILICLLITNRVRHTTAGTPAYMAPELLRSEMYNKSVDVYAFAVLLWELLAEVIPYEGLEPLEVRDSVIGGGRLPMSRSIFDDSFQRLINSCW